MASSVKWCMCSAVLLSVIYDDCNGYRIIGGTEASLGEFPYQASIRMSYNDRHICGGTVMDEKHVLTAAHCLHFQYGGVMPASVVSVVFGQIDIPITTNSVYRNACNIYVHPDYDRRVGANDIGIIELSKELNLSSSLLSTLPVRSSKVSANTSCTVSGWGVTKYESGKLSNKLLKASVDIVDTNRCKDLYKESLNIPFSSICAGHVEGATDSCQGDSGGPLVCDGLLTGIVSSGIGCGNKKYPGLYTEVSKFRDWMKNCTSLQDDECFEENYGFKEESETNHEEIEPSEANKTMNNNGLALNFSGKYLIILLLFNTCLTVYHCY